MLNNPTYNDYIELIRPVYQSSSTKAHVTKPPTHHKEHNYVIDEQREIFKNPLPVISEKVDDRLWISISPNILTHGSGITLQESILDLVSMLLDYYKELSESEEVLSNQLYEEFVKLKKYLHSSAL